MADLTADDLRFLHEQRDRALITDLIHRYSRAVDRLDADLLRSVYWPDGTDDHGRPHGDEDLATRGEGTQAPGHRMLPVGGRVRLLAGRARVRSRVTWPRATRAWSRMSSPISWLENRASR